MRSGGPRARARAITTGEEPELEPLVGALESLSLAGASALVDVVASPSLVSSPRGNASAPIDPQGVSPAPAPVAKASALVAVGAEPKRRARPQATRYYICTRAPADRPDLLGLHVGTWATVSAKLPGGSLIGSGCVVAGFNLEAEAVSRWVERGWELPCPLCV